MTYHKVLGTCSMGRFSSSKKIITHGSKIIENGMSNLLALCGFYWGKLRCIGTYNSGRFLLKISLATISNRYCSNIGSFFCISQNSSVLIRRGFYFGDP